MMSSLVLATLLASPTADATEIGTSKKFGLGAELGNPVSVTGKYFLSEKTGLSLHLGTGWFVNVTARLQFEMEVWEIADWSFARFGLYWDAGLTTQTWIGAGWAGNTLIGINGGAGVDLQFHDFPLSVYAEPNVVIYPLGISTAGVGVPAFGLVSYTASLGARYYF